MIFDDNILKKLPDNPRIALYIMCEHFLQLDNERADNIESKAHFYYRAYAALLGVLEATTIKYDRPKLIKDPGKDVAQIRSFFRKIFNKFDFVSSDVQLSKVHNKFQSRFTPEFGYTFTDGDLSRIQTLINELRDLIYKSELFEEKHKQRILEKLENLQKEIHKKMTSLAIFWDLLGDAGVALG